jgi:hypothetical protein
VGVGISAPVLAQSPYVAGAIGADISRFSHAESNGAPTPSNDSEVLSGSLRVGTSVGSNWGVELEFVRSGRSHSQSPIFYPLAQAGTTTIAAGAFTFTNGPNISIPIPFEYRSDVTQRHESFDAVVWARQPVGGSVDLVYLGGVAFSRDRSDTTQTFTPGIRTIVPPAPFRSTFIEYATRPLVGMEARIGLTSRLRLMPGLRVQGLGEGWLLRPYIGLGWFF